MPKITIEGLDREDLDRLLATLAVASNRELGKNTLEGDKRAALLEILIHGAQKEMSEQTMADFNYKGSRWHY